MFYAKHNIGGGAGVWKIWNIYVNIMHFRNIYHIDYSIFLATNQTVR